MRKKESGIGTVATSLQGNQRLKTYSVQIIHSKLLATAVDEQTWQLQQNHGEAAESMHR